MDSMSAWRLVLAANAYTAKPQAEVRGLWISSRLLSKEKMYTGSVKDGGNVDWIINASD